MNSGKSEHAVLFAKQLTVRTESVTLASLDGRNHPAQDCLHCAAYNVLPTQDYQRCTTSAALPALHYQRCTTSAALPALHYQRCTTSAALPALHCQRCTASAALPALHCQRCTASAALPALHCQRWDRRLPRSVVATADRIESLQTDHAKAWFRCPLNPFALVASSFLSFSPH
ncbi:hypothetical protein SV7mr_20200 [Stieleria bergensis]|uniref:Uncharacterized protein n=1 Tax=Stieleria bergensis TaxID=2528025 RepID=A0A517STQ5_9BACT|nr:hypothetical protein SV7mr_20200 [Planctomycetes bacterium SV_7m_r]